MFALGGTIYLFPANNTLQWAQVQYILDSVVSELRLDPNKRFIYVEVAFFARWWRQQSKDTQHEVRLLVNEGNLK